MNPGRTGMLWCSLAAVLLCGRALAASAPDVPYVPTPMTVVDAMLELGGVGRDDVLVDLGSGDGRISIRAATRFGTRGLGVDLDERLVAQARAAAAAQGVQDKVVFEARNLFHADISHATVVTSYLSQSVNIGLRPRLFAQLKPGTRIVSHDFDFGDWLPDQHIRMAVPGKAYGAPHSDIMLWVLPADFSGTWTWRLAVDGASRDFEAVLEQVFQQAAARGRMDGRPAVVTHVKLRGDALSFTMSGDIAGRAVRHDFKGRLAGDTISGSVTTSDASDVPRPAAAAAAWQARRVRAGNMQAGVSMTAHEQLTREQ